MLTAERLPLARCPQFMGSQVQILLWTPMTDMKNPQSIFNQTQPPTLCPCTSRAYITSCTLYVIMWTCILFIACMPTAAASLGSTPKGVPYQQQHQKGPLHHVTNSKQTSTGPDIQRHLKPHKKTHKRALQAALQKIPTAQNNCNSQRKA
jgi:hypothetical protein